MPAWLSALLRFAIGPIAGPIRAIVTAISTVWNTVTGFFTSCGRVFNSLRIRAQNWIRAQIAHAEAVFTTLKWIITTYVPRIGAAIAAQVRAWTAQLIDDAENLARGLVDVLSRFTQAALGALTNALTALRSWALAQVAALVSAVNRLLGQVFGILGTPERLALWAIDAIMHAGLKWVSSHIDALTAYLWSRRAGVFTAFNNVAEELFSKIL